MSTRAQRSVLIDLAIIVALAAIAVGGYLMSPLLLPKADLTLAPLGACDLHQQACVIEAPGGGRIELGIAPRPIPVVKPLQVTVTLTGLTAEKIELDLAGETMNMGFNRVTLDPAGQGVFTGAATIPVCVTGRMLWRATLLVESQRRRIAVPVLFEAPLDGS